MEDTSHLGDLLAVSTAIVWSIAVLFFRSGGERLGAIPLKVFHNISATLMLFACFPIFSSSWVPVLSPYDWSLVAISAILGITIGDTFYIAAINRIGAGGQALVDCLFAPTVIFFAFILFGENFSALGWVGVVLILSGVFLGHAPSKQALAADLKKHRIGLFYGFLSQLSMALCIILIRDILRKDSVLAITAYRYFIGTAFLILVSLKHFKWSDLMSGFKYNKTLFHSFSGTFLGPFLSTLLWFAGYKYTEAGRAAIYNQLSTIFIILLAALFLKEKLNFKKSTAVVLAILGGYLVAISNP